MLRRVRVTIVALEKKKIITYYFEYVFVALVIQQGKIMRLIILSYAACLILQYIYTLSNKQHGLRKKKLLHTKCML